MQIKLQSTPILLFNNGMWSLSKYCQLGEEAGADRIGRAIDCRTTDWPGSRGVAYSQSRPKYLGCIRDKFIY